MKALPTARVPLSLVHSNGDAMQRFERASFHEAKLEMCPSCHQPSEREVIFSLVRLAFSPFRRLVRLGGADGLLDSLTDSALADSVLREIGS